MCGIWLLLTKRSLAAAEIRARLAPLEARGPEGTAHVDLSGNGYIGFTRLAINGLTTLGMQPMQSGPVLSVTNGEIYNWRAIEQKYALDCTTGSDCEVVGKLYDDHFSKKPYTALGELFSEIDGVFATAIVDTERDITIIARDPYGVRPLYIAAGDESLEIASEMKGLGIQEGIVVSPFKPGTYKVYQTSTRALLYYATYHQRVSTPGTMTAQKAQASVRAALEAAVDKRMMTQRPVAALLSGGLDSSLIASLVAKRLKEAGAPPLKTFSIGMRGSTDLKYAKIVADWIGSDHTEVVLSADDFFASIEDVIRVTETYDTTTIRASAGNWLVGKAVAQTDAKVVFNGDGSDELWGSYKYFFLAPSDAEYTQEVHRLLDDIHYFDVLRSDRCISSWGLEPRTPFLDKGFVDAVLSVPVALRRPVKDYQIEKWLLRKAFDDGVTLPDEVLWRRKESFSDGISGPERAWYEEIQERAAGKVPDDWLERVADKAAAKATAEAPRTPEMYYYRNTFEKIYGGIQPIPYFWMPKWTTTDDPSARTIAGL